MARVIVTGAGSYGKSGDYPLNETPEAIAEHQYYHAKEHARLWNEAERYPWQWPTAESVAEADIERHTCPECGSYVEDGDW